MTGCQNQLNKKYHSKLLVSNICHIEIVICIRKEHVQLRFGVQKSPVF